MIVSALKAAQTGMRRQADAFASAVANVTSATLETEGDAGPPPVSPTAPGPGPERGSDQLLDGMVDMMIAQRMFLANLRAAQAADEMLESAIEIAD